MMRFRIKHFKSFEDTGWIELRPLTIFLGANGTGKSTLMQPFLLLGQTLGNCHPDASLITNGDYIKAGNYLDIVHNHDGTKSIQMDIDFDECSCCDRECDAKKKGADAEIGDLPPSVYTLEYVADDQLLPVLIRLEIKDCLGRVLLRRRRLKSGQYNLKFFQKFNKEEPFVQNLIKNHKPKGFLLDDSDILKGFFKEYDSKGSFELGDEVSSYVGAIAHIERKVRSLLYRMKYIGPVRVSPKRIYEYNKEYHYEVGKNGENAACMLFQSKGKPDKAAILREWLAKFEFASDFYLDSIDKHPELFSLTLKSIQSDIPVNYSDTCFGCSQLLPILVQAIYSLEHDTVYTEQPGLHLNPYLETTLADFVVAMLSQKRHFVIETHSEHLFLRLRTHIKRGELNHEDVAIYFTENTNGACKARRIVIDEEGEFPNDDWPEGFFEQSLAENLMFATAEKKND